MHPQKEEVKGFTLIELLIAIGIIAVLAVAIILILNPSEILRQTRDSNRISDLSTLKMAIVTYIADMGAAAVIGPQNTTCFAHPSSTLAQCKDRFKPGGIATLIASRKVDGNGWIPINFNAMSVKAPITILPLDPVNNSTYFYAYKADQSQLIFEINAKMESKKYSHGGQSDVESRDGGSNPDLYEVGSVSSL